MTDSVLPKPKVEATPDGYRVTWEDQGIVAEAEWVEQDGRELTCELSVKSTRAMSEGWLLAPASFNLSAPRTRQSLAGQLKEHDPDMPWAGMIEQLVLGVRERHRRGEPTIDMRLYAVPDAPLWHVEPLLETGGPTVLYGDGDTGKTTLAIALAVTAASGTPVLGTLRANPAPVLFLDYEGSPATFRSRLGAMCEGADIPIPEVHYRREYASLQESARQIRREVEAIGARTVIVDSIGIACGGAPEAADVTLAFFRAVDSLRTPCFLIDHITKNGGDDQGKAYGSVYKHNRPRLTWQVSSKLDREGTRIVAMRSLKHNDFGALPRLTYRVAFEVDANKNPTKISIGWADAGADPGVADALLRGWPRLDAALRGGGLTPLELASLTDQGVATVERTLRRYSGTHFTLKEGRWWNLSAS